VRSLHGLVHVQVQLIKTIDGDTARVADRVPARASCVAYSPSSWLQGANDASGRIHACEDVLRGGVVVLGTGMHHYAQDGRSSFSLRPDLCLCKC
jgi:hypothetical protein